MHDIIMLVWEICQALGTIGGMVALTVWLVYLYDRVRLRLLERQATMYQVDTRGRPIRRL